MFPEPGHYHDRGYRESILMPEFSANISTLFREVPMVERIGAAAAVGFDAIEIQFPYAEHLVYPKFLPNLFEHGM